SAVPTGLGSSFFDLPRTSSWAIVCRPSGAGASAFPFRDFFLNKGRLLLAFGLTWRYTVSISENLSRGELRRQPTAAEGEKFVMARDGSNVGGGKMEGRERIVIPWIRAEVDEAWLERWRRNPKRIGELSQAMFLQKASSLGFGVALPWG